MSANLSVNLENLAGFSTNPRLIGITLSIMFLVTGCSTFSSTHESNLSKSSPAASKADSMTGKTLSYRHEDNAKPVIDKVMDDWEKSRAAYLRSLDYEQIEQQNNDHDKYLLKSNLIESRYHIKNAETATYVEQDYQKALTEMRQAEQHFKQAIVAANPAELNRLEATESNLEGLLKNSELTWKNACLHPQSTQYHQVEANIENLIVNI